MLVQSISSQAFHNRSLSTVRNTSKPQVDFGMCPLCVAAAGVGVASVWGSIPVIGWLFRKKKPVVATPALTDTVQLSTTASKPKCGACPPVEKTDDLKIKK